MTVTKNTQKVNNCKEMEELTMILAIRYTYDAIVK